MSQNDAAPTSRSDGHGSTVNTDVVFGLFVLAMVSGTILIAGYALPSTVGTVVAGEVFLVAGVTFFGVFLVLLSILPEPERQ